MAVITSEAYKLIKQDIQKWSYNTLLFSAPALLALAVSLQQNWDLHMAAGMAAQALLASTIDLLRKFLKENKYK